MPKLWSDTIEKHREEVRDAILATAAGLAADRGPFNVTMSQIAEGADVSRATLYKYFPSVEDILDAWHERHIHHHLERLRSAADREELPLGRLGAVLADYADIRAARARSAAVSDTTRDLASFLHRPGGASTAASLKIHALVRDLVVACIASGEIRSDFTAGELAHYCLRALDTAGDMQSPDAVERLVTLVLSTLQPTSGKRR